MFKKILVLALSAYLFPGFAQISVPAPSPSCKIEQKLGLGTVTVEYSRPGKKDRIVFGDLVPYGKMWRTGANAATKITFSDDVEVSGVKVGKGTYALFTVPGESSWDVILYSDSNVSGVPQNYDVTKEVAKVTVTPELIPYTFENFIVDFNEIRNESATLNLIWETTLVPIKLKFDTDSRVMSSIDKVLAGPTSNDYYQAARYYYDAKKDQNLALQWAHKANEMAPTFWKLRLESLILAGLGRKTEAIEVAQRSKALSIEANNDEYVKMNERSIQEWSN
ncbi:MAG: DUF2911 domain-containing protein [Saprospiraceae bacterium]|nr:DUF2911 domain-containing protein [Saprospiraceae bacterium]